MRTIVLGILAAASATTALANGPSGEVGYTRGALGFDALVRADYRTAEQQLEARQGVAANDPARLLNLGLVHWQTGRTDSARALFVAVRDSHRSVMLELANGESIDSRDAARRALARMEPSFAAR